MKSPFNILRLVPLVLFLFSATSFAQTIVDNSDSNTSQTGIWRISSGPNPYGANSVYNDDGGHLFSWYPNLPVAGDYEVSVWWTYHVKRSASVPYCVTHTGGDTCVPQAQNNAADGGKWNVLGTFTFDAGSNVITVSSENGQASADAVRYALAGPPAPPIGMLIPTYNVKTSDAFACLKGNQGKCDPGPVSCKDNLAKYQDGDVEVGCGFSIGGDVSPAGLTGGLVTLRVSRLNYPATGPNAGGRECLTEFWNEGGGLKNVPVKGWVHCARPTPQD